MVNTNKNLGYILTLASACVGINLTGPVVLEKPYGRNYEGVKDNLDSGYDPVESSKDDKTVIYAVETESGPKEVKIEIDNGLSQHESNPLDTLSSVRFNCGYGSNPDYSQEQSGVRIESQPSGLVIIIDETLKDQDKK